MLSNLTPSTRRMLVLAALVVVLIICIGTYSSQRNLYALDATTTVTTHPPLINGDILKNWLPGSVYDDTLNRLYGYIDANKLQVTSMSINGGITFDPATYDFDILLTPGEQKLGVHDTVTNYSGVLSTAVSINGALQENSVQSQLNTMSNGHISVTNFDNFDSLTNRGITTLQVGELQQALQTFAPNAKSITVNSSTVHSTQAPEGSQYSYIYTFSLSIDGSDYNVSLNGVGLRRSETIITDPKTKKVLLDSGIMNPSS